MKNEIKALHIKFVGVFCFVFIFNMTIQKEIVCDVIKQNKSELANIDF